MEILSTAVNAFVVAAVGVLLARLLGGRLKEVERRFDQRFEQVDQRFDKVDARMDAFQRSLDAMRSDLTQVALAVGAGRGTSGQRR